VYRTATLLKFNLRVLEQCSVRPDDFGEIDKALAVEDGPVIVNVRINGDVELPVSWEIAQALEMSG